MIKYINQAHIISNFVSYLMPFTASTEWINYSVFFVRININNVQSHGSKTKSLWNINLSVSAILYGLATNTHMWIEV